MTNLDVRNASLTRSNEQIVENASFSYSSGEFVALLGANGAGKTSLIRGALGLEKLSNGNSHVDGNPISSLSAKQKAQKIAYLPQMRTLAWPVSVREVVTLGRYSFGTGKIKICEKEAVNEALHKCKLDELSDRKTSTLSGGEIARVHCARMLASGANLIVADEPTLSLDPYHQFQIMNIFLEFVSRGGGVFVVIHDVQMAAKYASRLIWMKNGRIVGDGSIQDTLNEAMIERVYGVESKISGQEVTLFGKRPRSKI